MGNQIKAVVLDLGGVILRLNFPRLFESFGLPRIQENQQAMYAFDSRPEVKAFENGSLTEVQFCDWLGNEIGVKLSLEDFRSRWNTVFDGPVEGIESLLEETSRKLPLYCLTNSSPTHIQFAMASYRFLKCFRQMYTSFDLHLRKPDPAIYTHVCQDINEPAQNILYVDDRQENLDGARGVGMQAHYCADSSKDLRTILENALSGI